MPSRRGTTKPGARAAKSAKRIPPPPDEPLSQALAAIRAGDWEAARRGFAEMIELDAAPSAQVLEGLAIALYGQERWREAAAAMERAFTAFAAEGQLRRAVSAAAFMVSTKSVQGEVAAARGWEQRGLRLVAQVGPCIEYGYLLLADIGCEIHDPRELTERAEKAHQLALDFADHELELRAMAEMGLALVSRGQVEKGFALLDEAMVGAMAGEMPTIATRGKAWCAALSACERTGDVARAEYWCRQIEAEAQQVGILQVHCAVMHGVVEALRGRWQDAEARLVAAVASAAAGAHHRTNSVGRLAELRIQQGRYDEAEELLAGVEDRVEAMPACAHLHLVRGRYNQAAAILRSVGRALAEDYMRLAPILALSVEVELQRGDVAAATRAADRLFKLEDLCESNEIRSLARLGRARVALHEGDHATAIEELDTALTLLIHLERPMLTAQVRLEMARALARAGDDAGALVEAESALAAFHKLGIAPQIAASQSLIGLVAGGAAGGAAEPATLPPPSTAVESLTRREAEIAELVAQGLTNREVAARVFLSVRTVEYHVDRVLGKLDFHTRTQLAGWVQRKGTGTAIT